MNRIVGARASSCEGAGCTWADRLQGRRRRAQSLRDRRNRGAVAVAEDQGGEQVIAEVIRVAQFGPILLTVMGVEMELGPIMNDQGIVETIVPDAIACGLDQGPGQLRERDPVIGIESPGGLGTGERPAVPGRARRPAATASTGDRCSWTSWR